ncbi:MAG: ATP-binding protein [Spirochaetaceae bacterium]|jgi:predicted AAA+ superfamily ATPase|nr:ATP-binding protein [Spirochaetaceae bacterium]
MNDSNYIYAALADIAGLSLFAAVRESPVLAALRDLLEDVSEEKTGDDPFSLSDIGQDIISDWAAFTSSFIQSLWQSRGGYSFYLTVARLALADDNPYTHAAEKRQSIPPVLNAMARTDLSRLGRIASFEIHSMGFHIAEALRKFGLEASAQSIEEETRVLYAEGKKILAEGKDPLLAIFPENANWGASLPAVTEYLRRNGAGLLNQRHSFYWTPENTRDIQAAAAVFFPPAALSLSLRPVQNPDPIRLGDLYGYEYQRSTVLENTLRFLEGKYANNLLLYGDRGTGKSATVKAVSNEYAGRGLKLLEIGKSDLGYLSELLDLLAGRSLRFIIFIDDLSFETPDDSFLSLKALLEGGIECRPANVVIYATSNRRHLVREHLADRPSAEAAASGDMRAFDTMQEQFSLADRFGLTVIYATPGQEDYLRIAEHIAEKRGLLSPASTEEERGRFRENALKWEKWFNGRSPRTAVQYVDWAAGAGGGKSGGIRFPWD